MTAAAPTAAAPVRSPLYKSLFAASADRPRFRHRARNGLSPLPIGLKILSDTFLRLISLIVGPIVFCVVVHGIAGAGDLKKVGRVGVKALVYFEVMTTIALALGIILAFMSAPGGE